MSRHLYGIIILASILLLVVLVMTPVMCSKKTLNLETGEVFLHHGIFHIYGGPELVEDWCLDPKLTKQFILDDKNTTVLCRDNGHNIIGLSVGYFDEYGPGFHLWYALLGQPDDLMPARLNRLARRYPEYTDLVDSFLKSAQ